MSLDSGSYWSRFERTVLRADRSRRQLLKGGLVAGVGAVGAATVGCGSSSSKSTPTPSASNSGTATGGATASANAGAGTPKAGGDLTLAYSLSPSSLDPQLGNSGGDGYYWKAMFDTLVGLNSQYLPTANLSLATSWENPDPTTFIFHLRDGVTLHDGTKFDSSLVQWNIQRVQNPQLRSTAAASFASVQSVDTPDPLTATFKLKQPNSALLGLLGDRGGAIISRTAAEKYGDQFGSHPVGSGPFVFQEWVPNSDVKMTKNPNYWRKDASGNALPYLNSVTVKIIPDPTSSLASLQAGQLQLSAVAAKDVSGVQGNSSLNLAKMEGASIASLFCFNTDKPAVKDARVRQAISCAVNPDAVNKSVYFGLNSVAQAGMWPINTWVYQPIPDRPKYDVQKAKQLLSAAGVNGNLSVEMVTWTDDPSQVQQATLYQAQLKQVGIDAKISQFNVGTATANFFVNGMGDFYSTGWSRYPEPAWDAQNNYAATGYYNPMKKWIDPKLQDLLNQGLATADEQQRKSVYAKVDEIVVAQQAFYVPFLYGTSFAASTKKLQGTDTLFAGDGKWLYAQLWFS